MRILALLCLVILLALAGCSAPIDSTEPSPDPQTDIIGWEDGYWHNDSLNIDNSDGLNSSERADLVARAKARVEYIRDLEFNGSVNLSVVSRSNFSAANGGNTSQALHRFDNTKFEALMLVGGQEDAIETQEESLNQAVAGYYSPQRNAIVIVSDSTAPILNSERTLAHELVHALQDQHFDLSDVPAAESRDAHNGLNGLIEGDSMAVQHAYLDRCGVQWSCIDRSASNGATADGATNTSGPHLGVYLMQFFPYSEGPEFVTSLRTDGAWNTVNAVYDQPPKSATEIIYPARYSEFEPREIDFEDNLRDGWSRVNPPNRSAHARIGQSGIVAMFGYTIYDDYNSSSVISPEDLLNLTPTGVNNTNPINYDLPAVRGWTGDRLHVYHRENETAYQWELTWESAMEAEEFVSTYRDLLQHWGGEPIDDGRWRLPEDSPFAGVFSIEIDEDTVRIAHGNTPASLADIAASTR